MTQTKTQLPATTSAPLRRSRWNTHTTHVTCSSGTNALRSTSNRPGKPTLVRAGLSETPVDTSIDTNAAPTSKAVQLIQPCQRTDHLRWVQVRPERSQENRPDPRKKSAAPPFTPAFLDLIVATPSSTNTTLAGVAQSVERVALITAKRSTSRSWVRAPPSAIPMSKLIRAAVLLLFVRLTVLASPLACSACKGLLNTSLSTLARCQIIACQRYSDFA